MSLNRIRRLAGLTESVADDPHTNQQIEQVLRDGGLDGDTQARVLDALEALKNAGPNGLGVQEWASQVRQIDPSEFPMKDVLRFAATKFPFIVHKVGDKRFAWISSDAPERDMDPNFKAAAEQQIGVTYEALEIIKRLGVFSVEQLAQQLANRRLVSPLMAQQLAQHTVDQFHGMLRRHPDNRYEFIAHPAPTTADHMQKFRDLANRKPS